MTKRILFFVMMGLLWFACGPNTPKGVATDEGQSFGEATTKDGAIGYLELLERMKGAEKLDAKVVGTVESVCKMKGCWMNIAGEGEGRPDMFVQFKDYGFFMPKDIEGRTVVMDGYAYTDVTSVEDLRHFAEDEGKSEEEIAAITEPKEQLKFMASGVLLLPKKSDKN